MPTTVDPVTQISQAVQLIHKYQHQPDCSCSVWRDPDNEGFCNPNHARWSKAADRLLDTITALSAVSTARHRIKENQ